MRISSLLFGLHTLCLSEGLAKRLDVVQSRCPREALGIRATSAISLLNNGPVTNKEAAAEAGVKPLSVGLNKMRYALLGHALRRDGSDPLRATTSDRFGQPTAPRGRIDSRQGRAGPRVAWHWQPKLWRRAGR